ncbi:MAG TPA: carboxypeptidase regulatory-like domain-containing protein, partial [Vicinamibacterales bacterium]|nr:carboxypeptidase regulatory-like domain-containing protein [Vicinamibacterales bacterium]
MTVASRFAWLLVAAASVPALAQQSPPSIRGRVFAADNREALPRARVIVVADGAPGSPAYTDDRGEFTIAVPSATTFTLSIVKAGYAATQMPLQKAAFVATPVRDIAIALTRSAAVNGHIVD